MATDPWCSSSLFSVPATDATAQISPDCEPCFCHVFKHVPGVTYRAILRANGARQLVYISPRCRQVYGLEPEVFRQNPGRFWDLIHPEDVAHVEQATAYALQQAQPLHLEHRILTPEGQTRWLQVTAQPQLQPNGDSIWDGFVSDITRCKQAEQRLFEDNHSLEQAMRDRTQALEQEIAQRKQVESALRQSETALRQTLQAIPDLMVWTDPEGGCLEYFPGDEVKLYAAFKPGDIIYERLPPELAAVRRVSVQRALRTGKLQLCEQEIVVNGDLRHEEVRVVAVGADRVLMLVRDITRRKRLEEKRQQIEAALKTQQAFLRQVLNAIPCLVFVRDRQGNYQVLNEMCAAMYGVPPADLLGRHELHLNLVSAQQFQDFMATNQEVMSTLQPRVVTGQAIADIHGQTRWYQTLLSPFFDSEGRVQGVIGSSVDISHLKQTEDALRQAKETAEAATAELNALFAAMEDLILVLDREGRYLSTPGTHSKVLFELHLQHFSPIPPTGLPSAQSKLFLEQIQRCLQTQKTIKIQYSLPIDQREVWCDTSISPIDGDRVIWVSRDITLQKQIEAELQTQKDYLRQVIDVVPSAIYVKDLEGRVLTVNRAGAALCGLTVEPLTDRADVPPNLSPNEVEALQQVNQTVMMTRQTRTLSAEPVRSPEGEQRWYHTIINPFLDSAGQVRGIVGAAIDITELKHTQEELRQAKETAEAANRAKSTFLANMSHELRTPLSAILGFSQLMSQDTNLSTQQLNNLLAIRHSGEHLLRLVNQVLDLCKSEAGHATLHMTNFNLHQLLADVEGMFSFQARTKGVLLKIEIDSQVPSALRTDRVKLQQILINLLSNAIKFTASGSVLLRVNLTGDLPSSHREENSPGCRSTVFSLCFEVIDTGVGIDPQEFEQLFEAFVQTEVGRQTQEGTGLGLAISHHFIELMGGNIRVSSRGQCFSPGGGACSVSPEYPSNPLSGAAFHFVLPVQIAETDTDVVLQPGAADLGLPGRVPQRSPAPSQDSDPGAGGAIACELATLPPSWARQFKQTLVEGDLTQMLHLIDQLVPIVPPHLPTPTVLFPETEASSTAIASGGEFASGAETAQVTCPTEISAGEPVSTASPETIHRLHTLVKQYQFEQLLTLISPFAED